MRVTGGALRGRRLLAPPGLATRPTADRVRESLFALLARRLPGARVLDLYAGSGALGIESLSRGADFCLFVERQRRAAAVLRRNLEALALAPQSRVLVTAVERRLAPLAAAGQRFDLILLDPPYRLAGVRAVLARLAPLLTPTGRLAWEHRRAAVAPPPALEIVDARTYGQTQVTVLRVAGQP